MLGISYSSVKGNATSTYNLGLSVMKLICICKAMLTVSELYENGFEFEPRQWTSVIFLQHILSSQLSTGWSQNRSLRVFV